MTNEEITVKCGTSIKNTDAADSTRELGDGVCATRRCGSSSAARPCPRGDTATGSMGPGCWGWAWGSHGGERGSLNPKAAQWGPTGSYGPLQVPVVPCGRVGVFAASYHGIIEVGKDHQVKLPCPVTKPCPLVPCPRDPKGHCELLWATTDPMGLYGLLWAPIGHCDPYMPLWTPTGLYGPL